MVGDALVEDVPRIEPEAGADLQREADAVEDEAGVELDEPAGGAVHAEHILVQIGIEIHSHF